MKQTKPSSPLIKILTIIGGLLLGGPIGLVVALIAMNTASKIDPKTKAKAKKFFGIQLQSENPLQQSSPPPSQKPLSIHQERNIDLAATKAVSVVQKILIIIFLAGLSAMLYMWTH